MSYHEPARTAGRRARSTTLAAVLAVIAALVGVLGYQSSATPSSSSVTSPLDSVDSAPPKTAVAVDAPSSPAASASGDVRSENRSAASIEVRPGEFDGVRHQSGGALGTADGVVPAGTTVSDEEMPAVARLDPVLLDALRQAADDAADDGVQLVINSGWRSPEYQNQLLREAVLEYGSEEEAARWAATADTSAHVTGDAVDIGQSDATAWLSEHGDEYGLCQIYRNEPWHFELRPNAIVHGCPEMYADPTDDPRMQQ